MTIEVIRGKMRGFMLIFKLIGSHFDVHNYDEVTRSNQYYDVTIENERRKVKAWNISAEMYVIIERVLTDPKYFRMKPEYIIVFQVYIRSDRVWKANWRVFKELEKVIDFIETVSKSKEIKVDDIYSVSKLGVNDIDYGV